MFAPATGLITTPFGVLTPLVNDGTAQAVIKKALQSQLKFSAEFSEMALWPGGMGQTMTIPRERPIDTDEEALTPGQDPVYRSQRYEEMTANVQQYAEASRVYMLENAIVVKKNFASRWSAIGLAMAKKLNGVRRRVLYAAYNGGHAIANDTQGASTALPVSTICGFTHHLDSNGKLLPVSSTNPKRIRIGSGGTETYANVIAASPADATVPFGRGTLTLSANGAFTMGDAIVALDASHRVYVNGAVTVDGINTSATLTFAALREALVFLEQDSVPTHEDGTYWVHLSPSAKAQLWSDPEFQNLIRGGLEKSTVQSGVIGVINGFTFIANNLVPRSGNSPSGLQISRPVNFTSARLSKSFFNEVINKNGTAITHTLITGGGIGMTHYLNISDVSPESEGVPLGAKVVNGMTIETDNATITLDTNVRFMMVSPRDDLKMWLPINGLFLGGFMVNSDYYGGSFSDSMDLQVERNPRFKRAVTVVHYGT
jgi:hypothetical protein